MMRKESERAHRQVPRFYNKRAWRDRIRPRQLREHPLCQDCQDEGFVKPATDVDHLDGNPNNNAPENLRSRCHSHHSRKTAAVDGGFGNSKG